MSLSGLKSFSCKLHGLVYRKSLVSVGKVFYHFPLLRLQLKYKEGHTESVKTLIIYPSDVYPYGRQTLDVVNEVAVQRHRCGDSWYRLESRFYEAYDFSLNRIKGILNRVELVFNRLISSRIIPVFREVSDWIKRELRNFQSLTFIYRSQMVGQLLGDGGFMRDLFSP